MKVTEVPVARGAVLIWLLLITASICSVFLGNTGGRHTAAGMSCKIALFAPRPLFDFALAVKKQRRRCLSSPEVTSIIYIVKDFRERILKTVVTQCTGLGEAVWEQQCL